MLAMCRGMMSFWLITSSVSSPSKPFALVPSGWLCQALMFSTWIQPCHWVVKPQG